jgi:hypothetical protein
MAKNLSEIYSEYNLVPPSKNSNEAEFYTFSLNFLAEHNWVLPNKSATQTYINLSFLLKYIENNQNIFTTNDGTNLTDSFLKFDTDKNNFMLTYGDHISSDPRICLIPNINLIELAPDDNAKSNIIAIKDKFKNECNAYVGRVMYLLINVEYLVKLLFELKDDKGQIVLDTFIRRLLSDINSSLGNINQLTYKIFDDNRFTIVEEAPLRYDNLKVDKNYARFNVYGVNPSVGGSFVKNIDFNVTITNEFASSIAIGAQANGNQPGQNSTAFSEFNKGLIDRNAKYKTTDNNIKAVEIAKGEKSPEEQFQELRTKYTEAVKAIYKKNGEVNDETVSSLSSLNNDFSQAIIGDVTIKKEIPAPFFLPFDMNLSMKGLTGMKIFERFALSSQSEKILPSTYRDDEGKSLIDFIIFDIKHSIKDNVWDTQIRGKTVPSENNLASITARKPMSADKIPLPSPTPIQGSELCPKTAYPEFGFTNPRPPANTLPYSEAISYLKNNYPEAIAKAVFAVLFAEASKRGEAFISAGGHNYAGVQTDNARWGAPGIVGQYCRIDSGGVARAFAIFESDQTFLGFMANRIIKKGFNGLSGDQWTLTYINSWWSPKEKASYTKGTIKYNQKLAIYNSAIKRYNNLA